MSTKRNDFIEEINGDLLEYFDESHTYLVNGIQVPSITQILGVHFGDKYTGVSQDTLEKAAERGTAIHEAIEAYVKGQEGDTEEVRNFKFLEKMYGFTPVASEIPVILYDREGNAAGAGRLDLVLKEGDLYGLGDIKSTYNLDINYLGYQLNMYRLAFMQDYDQKISFLRAIHLRGKKRVYKNIPINKKVVWEALDEWRNKWETIEQR